MLYRRFPGCRKRRSAHTTSHGRCQGAQRVAGPPPCRATFGTSRLPSLPLSRRRVLFAAVPTRPRWLRMGIRINQAGLVHSVRRRNQPSAVDARGHLFRTLSARRPCQWAGGRTRCYTVRGLCISTLHVSLIIRVLPRAESATGCIFRQLRTRSWRHYMSKAGISEAFAGRCVEATGRAEVRRKESGKQAKNHTCRFFSVFSTQRWWRFQAIR
ncbi:hypothetical protein QFZ86_002906 [Pseudomonas plecoglossicida]